MLIHGTEITQNFQKKEKKLSKMTKKNFWVGRVFSGSVGRGETNIFLNMA
jgi:hypothetical protein